eukprot:CAMPEP_0201576956 /NCGR_PEP_ID=MMETSP0190_2-20130828/23092_1 /ASSEMBLY_ACC=CAM_ASM_000263 /TAXON_ID=37353 /ORGANISM="Rosalina sp." /LENGTH=38 /DNA_ID= /DNA_START= /DNA_END= /DNA_ORIENTATION=
MTMIADNCPFEVILEISDNAAGNPDVSLHATSAQPLAF